MSETSPRLLFSTISLVLFLFAANRVEAGVIVLSTTSTDDTGYTIYKLYAEFNNPDIVTAVTDFNYVAGGPPTFYHADALTGGVVSSVAGTWNPQFVLVGGATDSWAVIGGGTGFASGNSTAADSNWGAAGFNQAGIPVGAGWFNNNPPNLQGQSVLDGSVYKTLLGQFVLSTADATANSYTLSLKVTTNNDLINPNPITSGALTFNLGATPNNSAVPEPGSFIVMGLLGVAGFGRNLWRRKSRMLIEHS